MKPVFALTVCLSGILGAEAWVLPPGGAPKAGYALRPDDKTGNKNAADTKIKFSPAGSSSSGTKSNAVVAGFINPKTGGASRRGLGRRDDGDDGDDSSDDSVEGDPEVTIFNRPATKIGTLKKGETSGSDDEEEDDTKYFKTNNKKQNGKNKDDDKKKDDDKNTTKTKKEDSTKTKTSDDAKKTSKSKHSGDDDDKKTTKTTKTTKVKTTKTKSSDDATKTPKVKDDKKKGSKDDKVDDKKKSKST
ncbi:uncharacterized protein FFB14_07633 [Fusarium fujikuroi]|nr:uncharacterized protein FFB14_07633 [Fusarium fujikuroi]